MNDYRYQNLISCLISTDNRAVFDIHTQGSLGHFSRPFHSGARLMESHVVGASTSRFLLLPLLLSRPSPIFHGKEQRARQASGREPSTPPTWQKQRPRLEGKGNPGLNSLPPWSGCILHVSGMLQGLQLAQVSPRGVDLVEMLLALVTYS